MGDWKNDRAEVAMREADKEMMKKAHEKRLKEEAEIREKEWLLIYEQCKNATSSPSMTRDVIQWFIENNFNPPTKA